MNHGRLFPRLATKDRRSGAVGGVGVLDVMGA